MVCSCVIKSAKNLNGDVANNDILDALSPGTLVTGRVDPSYEEVQALNFSDVQAHVPDSITNTNKPEPWEQSLCTYQGTDRVVGISWHWIRGKEYVDIHGI